MKKKKIAIAFLSTAMMVGLLGCNIAINELLDPHLVAQAQYPKGVAYEDYEGKQSVKDKNPVRAEYKTALQNFAAASATEIFRSDKKSTNITYSPISLYMALAISASAAKNQTQDEILSVLNMKKSGVNQLESQTGNLFRLLYTDNKVGKLHLANSLWLAKGIPFNKEYLDTATKKYYASLYSVDFADANTGDLISQWISENTNGLLQGSNRPNPQQILAIINTLYFYDEWMKPFSESQTKKDAFTLADGQTVTAEFMNDTLLGHGFIRGEGFLSSSLAFKNGSSMNFYLPDKGVDVYDLVSTPEKMNKLLQPAQGENEKKQGRVVFKIPKFTYGTKLPLIDVLKNMGMKQAFEPNADFSNLTSATSAYISEVLQESYISINEKGCEAAAYTKISMTTSGPAPSEEYADMILDRPFIYTITSPDDVVLFMGVINNPISE